MNVLLVSVGFLIGVLSAVFLGYVVGKRRGKEMAQGEFFDRVTHDTLVFGNSFVQVQRLNPESVRLSNVKKPYGSK